MGVRILHADNVASGPAWLSRAGTAYSETRLSESYEHEQMSWESFRRDLERYLVTVATRDAWLTDPITRQQTKVMDMKVACRDMEAEIPGQSIYAPQASYRKTAEASGGEGIPAMKSTHAKDALNLMLDLCLSTRTNELQASSGRLLIVSESGMGKTLLTKQITSQAAQTQLIANAIAFGREKGAEGTPQSETSPALQSTQETAAAASPQNDQAGEGSGRSDRSNRRESWEDGVDLHKYLIYGGIIDDVRRLCKRMVPVRVPMIDFPNLYRRDPNIVNSNPQKDFLALWTGMTYGTNGLASRLIRMAREASMYKQQGRRYGSDEQEDDASECFLLIVFDGLDECGDLWRQGLEFVTNFVKAEPRHAVVLTARPWEDRSLSVLKLEHNFSHFGINPLPTIQAEMFCRRKMQLLCMPEDATERIVRLICYSSEFKEMRTIPLLLSLLLHLHKMLVGNPAGSNESFQKPTEVSRTKIFRHAVHLMVYQVGANKVAHRDVLQHETLMEMNRCRFLLRYAAWIAHHDRALTFATRDRNVALHRMATQRSRTAPVYWAELRIFAEHMGLLKPLQALMTCTIAGHLPLVTGDKNQFRFARLAYEELLCGEFLACALMQDQTLTPILFGQEMELIRDETWVEPILHCMMTMNESNMQQWLLEYICKENGPLLFPGCYDPIKRIFKGGNKRSENSLVEELMFTAVKFGARPVVDTLLQAQCNPDIRCKAGNTPLHYAARNGYTSVVDSLINVKACPKGVKAFNDNFRTPVQEAVFYGHVDVYRMLTRNTRRGFPTDKALRDFPSSVPPQSSRNLRDFTNTLSMDTGVESMCDDVTSLHLTKGKLSPLIMCASEGSAKVVEAILESIPPATIDNRCPGPARASALCFAAENGRANVVKLLLDWKANVNIRYGPDNCSVLFWPSFAGYVEVVNLLLEAQANPDGDVTKSSMEPRYELQRFNSSGSQPSRTEAQGLMVDKRATFETCNSGGANSIDNNFNAKSSDPSHRRTTYHNNLNKVETTKVLTPIHVAAATGQTHVIALLIRYNANVDFVYKPLMLRPIHFAAFYGSDSAYRLLGMTVADQEDPPIKTLKSRDLISAEEVRHLHECPPESMFKHMRVLSTKMEKLF